MRSNRKWIVLIFLWTIIYGLLTSEAQANIILKSLVVNPSRVKTQTAMMKTYLPKEVKPEDVVEMGDLKIDFDVNKSLYFVYKEFELKPGESVIRQIEIKDIWVVPKEQLDNLNAQANNYAQKLKKTTYFEAASGLQKQIEENAAQILVKQVETQDAMPQTHIAAYRQNLEKLDLIKGMLAKLDKMVLESSLSTGAIPVKRVSVRATWWVILGVVVVLGLLSLVFFIIWQRQATIAEEKQKQEKEAKIEQTPDVSK